MKRILFYASNSVGLGHLRRVSLIAEAVPKKNPRTEVKFVVLTNYPHFLDEAGFSYIQLEPPKNELLKNNYQKLEQVKKNNNKKLEKVIGDYQPEIIAVDVFLFGFSFPWAILKPRFDKIKKVLIIRFGSAKNYYKILRQNNNLINSFDKIIIPHSEEEISRLLSKKDYLEIKKEAKFEITGPIIKKINKQNIVDCKKRYRINKNNFLLTVALGGGGELTNANCESPQKIVQEVINAYARIKQIIPDLKLIICLGPAFKHQKYIKNKIKNYPEIKLVSFERYLPELLSISDLIIASAGYNICNEIIQAKTPAILMPLNRNSDEQYERANFLKNMGIVKVFDFKSKKKFFKIFSDCFKELKTMRQNFEKIPKQKQGDKEAVKVILNL
ncbi:hypothetical protein COX47_01385 [Candidatus Roizmanbacteria bacterium CG23_combo_of_CG06-09_8_20_14_all_35_49]|uniref:Glycosyl transferase family 28 C-terminal domain-containing protein n=1 Tax=Candidatus Roizmanbacteria bacterium CG23_combo_of_CG06-09_8_20_14_all_35_49 TaxID=1974863 RepID=A0A2G9Y7D0_9BACT|nr:MAG: hypothetical protein COX47_01385 [Candidatus Roizmanbacteria bacterium CG23_combo_of_CG06-09_8_20_14_all_35_49]